MSITTGDTPVATPLTLFLVQLILVVTLSKLLSAAFKYIKQPTVIAEVVTGILLGPSAFGHIPGYVNHIFPTQPTDALNIFSVIANLGLIIFMFMVGLEIDSRLLRRNVTGSLFISMCAMVCPFALGLLSSWVIHHEAASPGVSFTSFLLFVAVAMSITAFPVLARILTETNLLATKVGSVSLSAAAVDDVVSWCILALVVSIARAKSALTALYTFLLLLGFVIFMFGPMRILLSKLAFHRQYSGSSGTGLRIQVMSFMLILVFVCAWFTEIIGVHAIFGAFILGVVTPRKGRFAESITEKIEDLVVIILLPLYFTFSGLRTNIGALNDGKTWGLTILVILTACVGKGAGATLSARILKNSWRESFTIGILMNCKGLVELIVLNVGLDVGVLNTKVFTMFVIMALVTTFATTPLVHLVYLRKFPDVVAKARASKHAFSVVLNATTSRTARKLISASSIFSGDNGMHVKALLLKEISDRPSSFFFGEMYHGMVKETKPLVPGSKDNRERKGFSAELDAFAKSLELNIEVETKVLITSNIQKDVVNYIEQRLFDLALFQLHAKDKQQLEEGSSSKSNIFESLAHASGNALDSTLDSIQLESFFCPDCSTLSRPSSC